jgi:hypothetical protein
MNNTIWENKMAAIPAGKLLFAIAAVNAFHDRRNRLPHGTRKGLKRKSRKACFASLRN